MSLNRPALRARARRTSPGRAAPAPPCRTDARWQRAAGSPSRRRPRARSTRSGAAGAAVVDDEVDLLADRDARGEVVLEDRRAVAIGMPVRQHRPRPGPRLRAGRIPTGLALVHGSTQRRLPHAVRLGAAIQADRLIGASTFRAGIDIRVGDPAGTAPPADVALTPGPCRPANASRSRRGWRRRRRPPPRSSASGGPRGGSESGDAVNFAAGRPGGLAVTDGWLPGDASSLRPRAGRSPAAARRPRADRQGRRCPSPPVTGAVVPGVVGVVGFVGVTGGGVGEQMPGPGSLPSICTTTERSWASANWSPT